MANVNALIGFLARSDLGSGVLSGRPLIVGDSKMVTDEAVLACHRHGLTYLGPLPLGEKQTTAIGESVADGELKSKQLAYRPRRQTSLKQPFVPYKVRSQRTH